MPTVHLVIPALNEAANIGHVLADLRAARDRLPTRLDACMLLVDDGSTDGTSEVARAAAGDLNVEVLRHDEPQGPGRAFATAFARLEPTLSGDDFVLTLEADNTSRVELLERMVLRSREGYDAVFASPYAYGGGIVRTNPVRTGLSHLANTFVKEFLGIRGLFTVSSFFRLYRGSAVRRLQEHFGPGIVERAGFESMAELTLKMVYMGMSISEVAMVLDSSRRVGNSKMRIGRTGLGYLALFRRRGAWKSAAAGDVSRSGRSS
jgi:dolichol-phosphate mannosyltransferase